MAVNVECVETAADGSAGEDGALVGCAAGDQSVVHLGADCRVVRDCRALGNKLSSMDCPVEVKDRRVVHGLADMAKAVDYQDAWAAD